MYSVHCTVYSRYRAVVKIQSCTSLISRKRLVSPQNVELLNVRLEILRSICFMAHSTSRHIEHLVSKRRKHLLILETNSSLLSCKQVTFSLHIYSYYIYFACLRVCLFVCPFVSNNR